MIRKYLPVIILTVFVFSALTGTANAQETQEPDPSVKKLQIILSKYQSPLSAQDIMSFYRTHPGFDVGRFLTVMWCESSLGTTGKSRDYNNPGNIIFVGWSSQNPEYFMARPWLLWQNGYFHSQGQRFGSYSSMEIGTKAVLNLLSQRYSTLWYDWSRFGPVYYGKKAGVSKYVSELRAAHKLLIREAAAVGWRW